MRPQPLHGATRAVALVASIMVFAGVVAGPVLADTQSELNAAEKKLAGLVSQIASENTTIAGDQAAANALAVQIDSVQNQIARTAAQIASVRREIKAASEQLAASQAELNLRAWTEYENGPGGGVDFVLSSTSLADLNERVMLVNSAAATDEQLILEVQRERTLLQAKQFQLNELEQVEADQQANLQGQEAQVQAKLADEKATLDQLSKDQAAAQSLVTKLKAQRAKEIAAAKLAAELARQRLLAQQQANSGGGTPSSGTNWSGYAGVLFACPVAGPHTYTDDFGAPRVGHIHAGIDIDAGMGTPIVAPFPGNAVDSYDSGGGNDVYVYGSQGYVFNAHLSAYGATGPVSTGTVIGYVGATGDATGPHDHFEWHPNVIPSNLWTSPYGYSIVGTAIDAYPYLNTVC